MSIALKIKDRPGVISMDEMRERFERCVRETSMLENYVDCLTPNMVDGKFTGYLPIDTDRLWFGFALGMRCSERLSE